MKMLRGAIREYWQIGALATVTLLGLSYGLFKWTSTLSGPSQGANGIVLSVWGLALSIVGFGVTLWQISKTKNALEAAEQAVRDVKSRVASYDSIVESSKALSLVKETQRHVRVPSWDSAASTYGLMRESIIRLKELSSTLTDGDVEELSLILADIGAVSAKIDTGLVKGRVTADPGRVLQSLRGHENTLSRIGIALQKEAV